ncbi:TPR-like protein [Ramicandelaber brevisporus]|nr:TPR-like protein [Ramicandelaber brevisporus]
MSRTKQTARKGKGSASASAAAAGKSKSAAGPLTDAQVEDKLQKASAALEGADLDTAYSLCLAAAQARPNSTKVLEATAVIEIDLGKYDEARERLNRCVSLDTAEVRYSPHMYLGQLSTGLDAVAHFRRGVEIMQKVLNSPSATTSNEEDNAAELKRKIAEGMCSIADIYLTDCCFEPDAEQVCDQVLQQAISLDPSHASSYQLLASVRLSQQRPDEARQLLDQSINIWWNLDSNDHPNFPDYVTRISTAKLLLETAQLDRVLALLERLQKEDDQSVDLWYLFGWTYFIIGESIDENSNSNNGSGAASSAEDAAVADTQRAAAQIALKSMASPDGTLPSKLQLWNDARECFGFVNVLIEPTGYDDEGIINHTQELLAQIMQVVTDDIVIEDEQNEMAAANAGDMSDDDGDDDDDDQMDMC